jgi:hypothetical protein
VDSRRASGEPRQLRLFDDLPPAPARSRAGRPRSRGHQAELLQRLGPLFAGELRSVVLTENRSRILTARPAGRHDPAGLHLRLDRCFADAPEGVLREVAAFCRSTSRGRRGAERRRQALATIREHFEAHRAPREPAAARPVKLRPRGERFDLRAIRDRINADCFAGQLTAAITWGRERPASGARRAWGCRRRRASLQLGSYAHENDLIRVHPALDRREVPEYVVASVVFHEMLHAALPPAIKNGRRQLHSAEFRRRERAFADHARAERWIRANLHRLLTT